MKMKKLFVLSSSLIMLLSLSTSTSVKTTNTKRLSSNDYSGQTLTIYNCDDYISTGSGSDIDLIKEFEQKYNCKVNYYTYDTNETMYNQFTLQKEGTYDLICTSEYMIQKMVKEGLVDKFDDIKVDVPNYNDYCSKELRNKLKNMKVTVNDEVRVLDDYVVGYMWGTLGIIYDSQYKDTIKEDAKSWDILWDSKYKNAISIKNSMRDSFVAGLIHHYSKEDSYKEVMNRYLSSEATEKDYEEYNKLVQDTFDFKLDGSSSSDKENQEKIDNVKKALIDVKKNIFGFEVDSGKNDIITGKIKINVAWSGDACYSIETALDERKGELILEYSVPEDGANIWYDGWTLPKGSNKALAKEFLNYISSPRSASANMDHIGYTPFIVGEDMYYTACNWYGAGSYLGDDDYYDDGDYVIFDEDGQKILCSYSKEDEEWCPEIYDEEYSYAIDDLVQVEDENGELSIYSSKQKDNLNHEPSGETDAYWKKVEPYDLNYLFEDTLPEGVEAIIYPYYSTENQLKTQYPDKKTVSRCAIMNDFGDYNEKVIIMWGEVKAYTDMTFTYIFLGTVLGVLIIGVTYTTIRKKLSTRAKRNASLKAKN